MSSKFEVPVLRLDSFGCAAFLCRFSLQNFRSHDQDGSPCHMISVQHVITSYSAGGILSLCFAVTLYNDGWNFRHGSSHLPVLPYHLASRAFI